MTVQLKVEVGEIVENGYGEIINKERAELLAVVTCVAPWPTCKNTCPFQFLLTRPVLVT